MKQSLFKVNSDLIDPEKREKGVLKLLVSNESSFSFSERSFGELVATL